MSMLSDLGPLAAVGPSAIVIDAEVLARVPDDLYIEDGTSAWAELQFGAPSPPFFLEGPVLDDRGQLAVVDLAWGRILTCTAEGVWSQALRYDGWPNGLALSPDGRLYVADFKHGVLVAGLEHGTVEPLLERAGWDRFRGVNDLTFDAAGNLYFTDQGGSDLQDPNGAVYRYRPSGELDRIARNLPSPNGLVYNEGRQQLYVAITRDNAIWRVQWAPDGTTRVGRWIRLSGGVGPDGLALDEDGYLYTAHLGLGVVWVHDPRGLPVAAIRSPVGDTVTNVTVDNAHNRVLATESRTGSILAAPTYGAIHDA